MALNKSMPGFLAGSTAMSGKTQSGLTTKDQVVDAIKSLIREDHSPNSYLSKVLQSSNDNRLNLNTIKGLTGTTPYDMFTGIFGTVMGSDKNVTSSAVRSKLSTMTPLRRRQAVESVIGAVLCVAEELIDSPSRLQVNTVKNYQRITQLRDDNPERFLSDDALTEYCKTSRGASGDKKCSSVLNRFIPREGSLLRNGIGVHSELSNVFMEAFPEEKGFNRLEYNQDNQPFVTIFKGEFASESGSKVVLADSTRTVDLVLKSAYTWIYHEDEEARVAYDSPMGELAEYSYSLMTEPVYAYWVDAILACTSILTGELPSHLRGVFAGRSNSAPSPSIMGLIRPLLSSPAVTSMQTRVDIRGRYPAYVKTIPSTNIPVYHELQAYVYDLIFIAMAPARALSRVSMSTEELDFHSEFLMSLADSISFLSDFRSSSVDLSTCAIMTDLFKQSLSRSGLPLPRQESVSSFFGDMDPISLCTTIALVDRMVGLAPPGFAISSYSALRNINDIGPKAERIRAYTQWLRNRFPTLMDIEAGFAEWAHTGFPFSELNANSLYIPRFNLGIELLDRRRIRILDPKEGAFEQTDTGAVDSTVEGTGDDSGFGGESGSGGDPGGQDVLSEEQAITSETKKTSWGLWVLGGLALGAVIYKVRKRNQ